MTNAPSAIDPTPWAAADYTQIFDTSLPTTFTATYGGSAITLWNVKLTIDETASPSAVLEADTSAAVADAMTIRPTSSAAAMAAGALAISTGYADRAQQQIFYGVVVEAESNSDGTAHIVANSWEVLHDVLPSTVGSFPYTVGSTLTTLGQAQLDTIGYSWSPVVALKTIAVGSLTAPASYTAFRQQQLDKTDTLLDFNIACANALGQWLRGDQRGRFTATSGNKFLSLDGTQVGRFSDTLLSDRWNGGTSIDLTPICEKWTHRRSADDYAEQLLITASYKSGNTVVTKTATYAGVTGALWAPLTKAVTVPYRAGAAFTAGTDRVAQAWADSYAARTWKRTANCRAVWWLEPGQRATIAGTTGTITKLVFDIDGGTMTIDLRPTVTFTP